MALPQLLQPAGTPPFLRDTHELEVISRYANTQVQTGAMIRRRMWVSTAEYANVVLELSTPVMAEYDEFFEDTLEAGTKKFSAQIQNRGPGLLWWSCRFFEPYTVEYLGGIWWRLSAKLILFDEGSVEGPEPTTLVGSVHIGLQATAVVVAEQPLSGSVVIALERNLVVTALSGSVDIALEIASYLPPAAVGSSVGAGVAHGVAVSAGSANVASATSVGIASGAGRSLRIADGSSAGVAVVNGVQASDSGAGSAAGTSTVTGVSIGTGADALLLETSDYLLLEDGFRLLLE
jgi:hypothetical protein